MKTNTNKNTRTRKSNEAVKTPKVSCEMKLNAELNGVELYFSAKPSDKVRSALKAEGFKWHSVKQCWYAKQSDKTVGLAEKLTGKKPSKKASSKSTASAKPKKSTKPSKKASKAKAEPKAPKEKVEQLPIAFECKSKPKASNKKLIKAINETEGLEAYTEGTWLWVKGEGTRSHSEALKSLGFRFGGRRQQWYLA